MNFERQIVLLAGAVLYKSQLNFKKKDDLVLGIFLLCDDLATYDLPPLAYLNLTINIESYIRNSKEVLYIENTYWKFSPIYRFQLIQLDILPPLTDLLHVKNFVLDLIEDSRIDSPLVSSKNKDQVKKEVTNNVKYQKRFDSNKPNKYSGIPIYPKRPVYIHPRLDSSDSGSIIIKNRH
ncbi:hypothetical protein BC833DRAFT_612447 [Globomyces pollinis-pini]|nr:hypothetical protein BC833DRAFT_612447 [Globomyces pollinis-pini]